MGSFIRTVDAAEEFVSVAEAKTHLRVTHSHDDTYIESLIVAARQWAEEFTRRAFVNQTWQAGFRGWPYDRVLTLPRGKITSVTSFKYYDNGNVLRTLSSSAYFANVRALAPRIKLKDTFGWPILSCDYDEPIEITYVAGFGDAADVPLPIVQAVKILIAHFYTIRVMVGENVNMNLVPMSAKTLLRMYRLPKV